MAKKKPDTILFLSRNCLLEPTCEPYYQLWNDQMELIERGLFWEDVSAASCFLDEYCSDMWEAIMPHLTLEPGQYAKVRVRHLTTGEKFEWADNWFWEHKDKD